MAEPASRVQDRRVDRVLAPSCPSCHEVTEMTVVTRTDYVVYFRCPQCGRVESAPKPNGHLGK